MSKVERFTQRARRVLLLSQENAEKHDHALIDVPHLLLGLWQEEGGVARHVMSQAGIEEPELVVLIERARYPSLTSVEQPELSDAVKRALELSVDQARKWNHYYIGTEHLLAGIVRLNQRDTKAIFDRVGLTVPFIDAYLAQHYPPGEQPLSSPSRDVPDYDPLRYYVSKREVTDLTEVIFDLARHNARKAKRKAPNAADLFFALWQVSISTAGWLLHGTGIKFEHLGSASADPPPTEADEQYRMSFDVHNLLRYAMVEVRRQNVKQMTPEHLLLAFLRLRLKVVRRVMTLAGLDVDQTSRRLIWELRGGDPADLPAIFRRPALLRHVSQWCYHSFNIDLYGDYTPKAPPPKPNELTNQKFADNLGELITYMPEDSYLYELRAKYNERAGRKQQAAEDYSKAADLNPSAAHLRLKVGMNHIRANEIPQALEYFVALVKEHPQNVTYLRWQGYAKAMTGNLTGGLADVDAACQLDANDSENFAFRAGIHLLNREFERVLEDCKTALSLNRNSGYARRLRGYALLEQDELASAEQDIKSLTTKKSDSALLALLLLKQKQLDDALIEADRVLELEPRAELAYYVRGKVYAARGDRETAVAAFENALKYWTTPDVPLNKPYIDELSAYLSAN